MREIKFRFWHSEEERMYEFDLLTYMSTREDGQEDLCPSGADRTPMQFTGLKDKNGKEIYEGDVIRQDAHTSYRYGELGQIEYEADYGGFIARGRYSKNQHHELLTCDVACECEIIGNIYEYPHLLSE